MFVLGRFLTVAALTASSLAAPSPQNTVVVNTTDNTPVGTTQATLVRATPKPLGGYGGRAYHSPAWLPAGENFLSPKLSQYETNGHSKLGTSRAPRLPEWMDGSALPGGYPWGDRTAKHTNYYHESNLPNTGVTRHYDFTLSNMTISPDGVEKQALVVNEQFPGPTIEANWGDWVEVVVHNSLDEGTAVHWHGLLQKETIWFDGVPGIQQCPIPPNATFTYRFRADLYGTSWYHAHFSAQFAGGLFGPMIIYGPHDNAQYDVDIGPVLIHDWFHKDYYTLVEQVMAPAALELLPPLSNNVLINGKNNYPCQNITSEAKCTPNAGVSKFQFQSGKTYRLRVINGGAEGILKFSIDGHQLTVFANDFVPLVPYTTDHITLGVGQRSDILVKATGTPTDAVWMRAELGPSAFSGGCSLHDGISPYALAAVYYEQSDDNVVPNTISSVPASALTVCKNDPLNETVPYLSLTPPATPAMSQVVNITYQSNGTNDLFYMNNSTFRVNYNDPVLLGAKLGHTQFPSEYNVYNFEESRSIRLVVYNHAQTGAHPMHLHGHNMYVIAEGYGQWDGTIVNAGNPQRRDVHLLQVAPNSTTPAFIVVQIDADNPGVWPFHCHIAWHVSGGLYMNILERPRDIVHHTRIPSTIAQTCRDWSVFSGNNVVDEIDSGL